MLMPKEQKYIITIILIVILMAIKFIMKNNNNKIENGDNVTNGKDNN